MAPVTIMSNRGIALQAALASGRGGVQNGSFNRRVQLSNNFGATNGEMFIDGDSQGLSRLRFPPGSNLRAVGTFSTVSLVNGVPTQGVPAVFDHTFVTTAAGVTTITANVAAAGFTVTKASVTLPNGLGTEDEITVTSATVNATTRSVLEIAFADQAGVASAAFTRQSAPAATIQNGRY